MTRRSHNSAMHAVLIAVVLVVGTRFMFHVLARAATLLAWLSAWLLVGVCWLVSASVRRARRRALDERATIQRRLSSDDDRHPRPRSASVAWEIYCRAHPLSRRA